MVTWHKHHGTHVGIVLHTYAPYCLLQSRKIISNMQHALALKHFRGCMQMVQLAMGTKTGGREAGRGSLEEEHMVICDAHEFSLDWGWQRYADISHTGNQCAWQPWRCHQAQPQIQWSAMAVLHMLGQHAFQCFTLSSKTDNVYADDMLKRLLVPY